MNTYSKAEDFLVNDYILKAEQITHGYGQETIIQDIGICLRKGEVASLLGISGVGKSTLFHILSGLLAPKEGRIWLEGCEITGQPGNVSYMLQKDLLLPHFTVLDNIILPKRIKGISKKAARAEAETLLPRFGLAGCGNLYPSQLSGGMRQRAALLRTYLFSKKVTLLDEPFSALDAITKSEMHSWYLQIMEEIKLSAIFITHDIDEAILLSDRIYIMSGRPGKITKELVIQKPGHREEDYMLTAEFLEYKKEIRELLR